VLVADEQCVTDGAGNYGPDEEATITAVVGGPISTKGAFRTERGLDSVTIKGIEYSGTTTIPLGLILDAGETFTWQSDGSIQYEGFTICIQTPTPQENGSVNAQAAPETSDEAEIMYVWLSLYEHIRSKRIAH
jgi:hypothetical protein